MKLASDEILAQASQWVVALLGPPDPSASDADRTALQTAFFEWITRSRDHLKIFLDAVEIYCELGNLDPRRLIDVRELINRAPNNVLLFPADTDSRGDAPVSPAAWASAHRYPAPTARKVPWLLVAALSGIILGGTFLLAFHRPAASSTYYATGIGQSQSITLPDRSIIRLNTNTRLEVDDVGGVFREVRLLAGEALFEVTHNPNYPFRVRVGNRIVQDVGTRFSVYLHGDTASVAVAEGKVEILPTNISSVPVPAGQQTEDRPMPLAENETADFDEHGGSHPVTRKMSQLDLRRRLSWTEGTLWFSGETLGEAAAEFNRYNVKQLIVDPSVANLKVGGIFPAHDPEPFVKAVTAQGFVRELPAQSLDRNPNIVRLGAMAH